MRTQSFRVRQVGLAIATVVLVACGGGTDIEDFGEQAVSALCERYERCGTYSDADTCREHLADNAAWYSPGARYDAALKAGRIRYDEDAARRCLDHLRDSACDDSALAFDSWTQGIEYDEACQFLVGQVPDDGACDFTVECDTNSFCMHGLTEDCQGVCKPRVREGLHPHMPGICARGLVEHSLRCMRPVGAGEACIVEEGDSTSTRPCASGLWCDASTRTCQRLPLEGAACDSLQGPFCAPHLSCVEGRCERSVSKGSACENDGSLMSVYFQCQAELFCDAEPNTRGTCQARLGEGRTCRQSWECADDLYCRGDDLGNGGKGLCRRPSMKGQRCDAHTPCGTFLTCSQATGTCVPLVRQGESCEDGAVCVGNSYCLDGRCVAGDTPETCGG